MLATTQQLPPAVVCPAANGARWAAGARHGTRYRVLASARGLCAVADRAVPQLTRQHTSASRSFGLQGPSGFHCLTQVTVTAFRGSCIRTTGAFSWVPSPV